MEHEWLIIFDNADGDPNTVGRYIPPGMRGNIIFTSRNPMMGQLVSSANARVEVGAMDEEDAVVLLLRSSMLEESPFNSTQPASAIARKLYCLPLAVDQAGAAIASGLCTIHDYLERYAAHRHELLLFPSFEGATESDRAVYTTLEVSYKAIQADASGASDLLRSQAAKTALFLLDIFAVFHYENISEEIIIRAAETPAQIFTSRGAKEDLKPLSAYTLYTLSWLCCRRSATKRVQTSQHLHNFVHPELLQLVGSGKWDPLFFREGIRILSAYSLIKRGTNGDTYFEHPLVHLWSRDRMSNELQQARRRSRSALLAQSITHTYDATDYAFRRDLIPHIMSCSSYAAGPGHPNVYVEQEYVNFSLVYDENGLWNQAEVLRNRVLAVTKRNCGEEHPSTLKSMHQLASTLQGQGRHTEAEALGVQVLAVKERVLGEEHPDTLESMHNLASIFWSQGRHTEAEELGARVLAVRKRVLGEEHYDTLESMGNLASIFWSQGRHTEAEELSVRVLAVRERVLGEEHPSTLKSMHNLASTFQSQGRHAEAEELGARVLMVRERFRGEEHSETLESMHDLASTFWSQGRHTEAEELGARVLAVRKRVLGVHAEKHAKSCINVEKAWSTSGSRRAFAKSSGMYENGTRLSTSGYCLFG